MFIVFEGIDGSGTTTQAGLLAEFFKGQHKEVCLTFEPSSRPIGRLIRQYLKGDYPIPTAKVFATLYMLDRVDHTDSVILPALRNKSIVISDRYHLSTMVYQGLRIPEGTLWKMMDSHYYTTPDVLILIDMPDIKKARARIATRSSKDHFDDLGIKEQETLATSYRTYFDNQTKFLAAQARIKVNGCQSKQKVFEDIMQQLQQYLSSL